MKVQVLNEVDLDFLAAQVWIRIDGSDVANWSEAEETTRERYRQYVRDVIKKEEAA